LPRDFIQSYVKLIKKNEGGMHFSRFSLKNSVVRDLIITLFHQRFLSPQRLNHATQQKCVVAD